MSFVQLSMELMWNWKKRRKDGDAFSTKRENMTSGHEGGEKRKIVKKNSEKIVKKWYNFVSY